MYCCASRFLCTKFLQQKGKICLIPPYLAKKNAHFDMKVLLENPSVLKGSKSWALYPPKNQKFSAGHEAILSLP